MTRSQFSAQDTESDFDTMSPIGQSVSDVRFRYRLRRAAYSVVDPSATTVADGASSEELVAAAEGALRAAKATGPGALADAGAA